MKKNQEEYVQAKTFASDQEIAAYGKLAELCKNNPIPDREILANLGLFLCRPALSRITTMQNIYLEILDVQGIVVEFGVRWGQNLSLFSTFRSMYEPNNIGRKIVGFDTFEGFPSVAKEDGEGSSIQGGALAVAPEYEKYLEEVLRTQEQLAPRGHVQKFELVKGDATKTLPKYLEDHPETVIALAYFDMDLYEPTKACLEMIRPYLTRGSVVGFDELAHDKYPGETQALKEAWGLSSYALKRDPISNRQSYLVID